MHWNVDDDDESFTIGVNFFFFQFIFCQIKNFALGNVSELEEKKVSVHNQPSRNYNSMCKNDYTHTVTLYITSVNLIAFAIECWKCDGG